MPDSLTRSADPGTRLLDEYLSGRESSFAELFRTYSDRVKRTAAWFLGSDEWSEDICQDVFHELARNGSRFKGGSSLSTYIFSITRNISRKYIRRLGSERHKTRQLAEAGATTETGDVSPEEKVLLNRALSRLSARYREPLMLYEKEGLKYGEIAAVLSIKEGTVKSRISAAREKLLKLFNRLAAGE